MSKYQKRLLDRAFGGPPFTDRELLEMFADENNWVNLSFGGRGHWVWTGPNIPPFEILQDHLKPPHPLKDAKLANNPWKHKQCLTTEDRDGNTITPTCAYCGAAEEYCKGEKDE